MNLELTDSEQALLAEILDQALRDLRDEIFNTDTSTFKNALMAREVVLKGLIAKVQAIPRA